MKMDKFSIIQSDCIEDIKMQFKQGLTDLPIFIYNSTPKTEKEFAVIWKN